MKLGSLQVSFSHINQKHTVCTVADREHTSTGIAQKSINDSFNRDIGRRTSLTKALKGMKHLTKTQKRNVWNDYRNMPKNPRW
jgi:hypothetical protein